MNWNILDKKPLLIDWACGTELPQDEFIGIDINKYTHVAVQADLTKPFLLPDNCVNQSRCSNFLEHLMPKEMVDFLNELWRVHKPKSEIYFRVPHFDPRDYDAWMAAMSDPTHVSYYTFETPTYFDINHFRWHQFAREFRGNRTIGIPTFKLVKRRAIPRFLDFVLEVIK